MKGAQSSKKSRCFSILRTPISAFATAWLFIFKIIFITPTHLGLSSLCLGFWRRVMLPDLTPTTGESTDASFNQTNAFTVQVSVQVLSLPYFKSVFFMQIFIRIWSGHIPHQTAHISHRKNKQKTFAMGWPSLPAIWTLKIYRNQRKSRKLFCGQLRHYNS